MSENENKAATRRYFEELNRGNLAILDELCSPEILHHTTLSPQPVRGLVKVKQMVASYQMALPDLHYNLEQLVLVAEGELVSMRWTATGHHRGSFQGIPPTGKFCTLTGMSIYRFENGKIIERWVVNDDLGMLAQLGMPRPLLIFSVLSGVIPVYVANRLKAYLRSKI